MTRPARPAKINAVFGAANEVGKVFVFEDSKVLFPLIVVLTCFNQGKHWVWYTIVECD